MIPLPLMKNLFFKVILFPLMITCSLYINSLGSTNSVETFVSNGNLKRAELRFVSSFFSAQQTENSDGDSVLDSIPTFHPDLKKRKEPFKAFIYALVPGAVVHGAGHFYAGKPWTGLILFGSELAGVGLFYLGAVTAMGDGEYSPGGAVAVGTGVTLFFGSWVYDAVFAPLSIKRKNEELLREKHSYLRFQIRDGDLKLVTVWQF
jgi:TM2 domain-containing membrane protein YozV